MAEDPRAVHPANWPWVAAIWLGVGLIDAGQTVFPMRAQGMHHAWMPLFVMLVVSWLPWALSTPFLMNLARRYPLIHAPDTQAAAMHLGALMGVSAATAAWSALFEWTLDPWAAAVPPDSYVGLVLARLSYGMLTSLIVYAFILAVTYAIDSGDRLIRQRTEAAQLGEQLSQAQLHALRQQLDPHFMFNTLNAISGLVRDGRNDAALNMIAGFGDLLRRTAEDSSRPRIALSEEVEYLTRFLQIQKIRFAERLQVQIDIPSELQTASVPNLVLQPLVENAIKHGISKRREGGAIRVAGVRSEDRLRLTVYNDGPCISPDWDTAPAGIGLSNLRTRLQILYGADFDLSLGSPAGGGVEAVISLPLAGA
jgi:two-component system, LytTR family, sensor kinase